VTIYARVTPAHKVRIVAALQRAGHVVAMTGDGANDAPAIRLADVGVALGGDGGTAAARDAADLVVTDGRIETLVDAIVEGRAVWASVRDALAILLGGNLGEILYTVAGSVFSRRPAINARQLLLVNLLTDMAPATAIALRPPRDRTPDRLLREGPDASLGSPLTRDITIRAVTTAGGATGAWLAARATGRPARARTVGLVALVGTQLGQTLTTGGNSPAVVATSVLSAAALAGIVQTPGLSQFFGCTPVDPVGWTIAGSAASAATATSLVAPQLAMALEAVTPFRQPTQPLGTSNEEARRMTTTSEQHEAREEARQAGEGAKATRQKAAEAAEKAKATREKAAEAAEQAKETGKHAGRAVRAVVAESAYATLVVGAVMVDAVRYTPRALLGLGRQVGFGISVLARRGRIMLGSAPDAMRMSGSPLPGAAEAALRAEAEGGIAAPPQAVATEAPVSPMGEPSGAPAPRAETAEPGEAVGAVTPPYEEAVSPEQELATPPFGEPVAEAEELVTPPFKEPVPDDKAGREDADYGEMSIQELRELARQRDIRGRSAMNREELIDALRNA
jgi:hypothetical protein